MLLSAPAVAGHAAPTGGPPRRVRAPRDLLEEPRVGRYARLLRGRIDDALEGFREAERDARAERVVGGRHRPALLLDVHELRIAAGHTEIDVPVRQLPGQLDRGLAEGVHQAEPEGWLQGCRDSASGFGKRVVDHTGDGFENPQESLVEGRDVNGHTSDFTMMSS